jgi:hypothetical protein
MDFWRPLTERDKPWVLREREHGTQVVLLGESEAHDTTQAPASVNDARRYWITRYLNSRFLAVPDHVELLVREVRARSGARDPGLLRQIHGQARHLEQRTVAAGAVELSDALCRWWLLDDDHQDRRREAALWVSTGHAAALFHGEIYDLLPPTRGGYQRLQEYGIRFGQERVVIYVEPFISEGRIEPNTARSALLLDHEPLPWSRWGREFAERMPVEIVELQNRLAASDRMPRALAIRARLQPQMSLYRLSPYRPPRPPTTRRGERESGATQDFVRPGAPGFGARRSRRRSVVQRGPG